MNNVPGLVETRGLVGTIEAAGAMMKFASVQLIGHEKIGSGLITVMVRRDVGVVKVTTDVRNAAASVVGETKSSHVIPRPYSDVEITLPKSVWPGDKEHCVKQSLELLEVSDLALAITCADAMAKAATIMLLAPEKTNGSGWMVVKIVGDVAPAQAVMMTGARLADRQQGLVAQKVIARPGASLPPIRVEVPSPAPDAALEEENVIVVNEHRDPADTLPCPVEQVTYSLCLSPHCPRQKGKPRLQCLHAGKRGDA